MTLPHLTPRDILTLAAVLVPALILLNVLILLLIWIRDKRRENDL